MARAPKREASRHPAWSCSGLQRALPPSGDGVNVFILVPFHGAGAAVRATLAPMCEAPQCAGRSKVQGASLQQQYMELQHAPLEERAARGCIILELAGIAGLERWAAARACHHAYGSRAQPGSAPGTLQALANALGNTVLCVSPDCGALVHLNAARRAARASGRSIFMPGDGCANRSCTRTHAQPARYARRQAHMASALLGGRRTLVMWPPTTATRVAQVAAPPALALAIASEAVSREPPTTAVSSAAPRARMHFRQRCVVLRPRGGTGSGADVMSEEVVAARRTRFGLASAGARRVVTGLVTRADLNGLPCIVQEYNAERERYVVAVAITRDGGETEVISVKPANLAGCKQVAQPSASVAAAAVPVADAADVAATSAAPTAEVADAGEEVSWAALRAAQADSDEEAPETVPMPLASEAAAAEAAAEAEAAVAEAAAVSAVATAAAEAAAAAVEAPAAKRPRGERGAASKAQQNKRKKERKKNKRGGSGGGDNSGSSNDGGNGGSGGGGGGHAQGGGEGSGGDGGGTSMAEVLVPETPREREFARQNAELAASLTTAESSLRTVRRHQRADVATAEARGVKKERKRWKVAKGAKRGSRVKAQLAQAHAARRDKQQKRKGDGSAAAAAGSISSLSVHELKRRIAAGGGDTTGCIEKADLVRLLVKQRIRDAKQQRQQQHFAQQQKPKRPRGTQRQEQRHTKRQRRQQA